MTWLPLILVAILADPAQHAVPVNRAECRDRIRRLLLPKGWMGERRERFDEDLGTIIIWPLSHAAA